MDLYTYEQLIAAITGATNEPVPTLEQMLTGQQ